MLSMSFAATVLAEMSACAGLGGGLYETVVVNPFWPARTEIIQPSRGGINRKWFWMPAHTVFELSLLTALVAGWPQHALRIPLLIALVSHLAVRLWSAFDFIPKALAFERAAPETIDEKAALRWTRRSNGRLILDLITCGATVTGLVAAARIA